MAAVIGAFSAGSVYPAVDAVNVLGGGGESSVMLMSVSLVSCDSEGRRRFGVVAGLKQWS